MNTALFFGSFNPFHLGHLQLGNYLVDKKLFDEVWYVVSPCNPLKNQVDLIDENLRLEMLVGAIKYNLKLKATDIEFTMPIPSYTIDTMEVLSHNFPENKFTLLIGCDNALVFDKWKNYKQLLDNFDIAVYPRNGYDFNQVIDKYPQMRLLNTPIYNISSTQIRDLIKQQKDVSSFVHPFVKQFIVENNLYRPVS